MYKVLLLENSLIEHSNYILSQYNYDIAYSIEDIEELTFKTTYNLIVANIYYLDTIKELKKCLKFETIFIDEYYNIVNLKKALLVGDDYLIKPLNIEEIKLRVEYRYRKNFNISSNILKYKQFFFNLNTKELFLNRQKIKLSPNESRLLEILLLNRTKYVSKDDIYDHLQSQSYGTLRVMLSKLKKLGFNIEYNRSLQAYKIVA